MLCKRVVRRITTQDENEIHGFSSGPDLRFASTAFYEFWVCLLTNSNKAYTPNLVEKYSDTVEILSIKVMALTWETEVKPYSKGYRLY